MVLTGDAETSHSHHFPISLPLAQCSAAVRGGRTAEDPAGGRTTGLGQ